MIIFIFLVWLILNAHFALDIQFLEIVLIGIVVSGLIYFFMIKFTKWNIELEKFFFKNLHLFIAYGFVLIKEVFVSNFKVLGLILGKSKKLKPEIVKFEVKLENEFLQVLLANSITLTPGTITITYKNGRYIVHCLTKELFDGFEESTLVKLLKKMENKKCK